MNKPTRLWRLVLAAASSPRRWSISTTRSQILRNSLGKELPNAAKQGIETYNGYSPENKADVTLVPEDGQ